jgi:hypothetical protein
MLGEREWIDYFEYMGKFFLEDCHTMSRVECYKFNDTIRENLKDTYNRLHDEHLFYKAVGCAKALSGNYISFSFVIVAILSSLLI